MKSTTKPLKVAFFIDELRRGAGTETQLSGLLRHLDPTRVEARLFTLRPGSDSGAFQALPVATECLGIHRIGSLAAARSFRKLVRALRAWRPHVSMIYFLDSNLLAVPASRLAAVPRILINRRDMGYWHSARLVQALRIVNRLSHGCVVNSSAVRNVVIARESFALDAVHVIPNALWPSQGPIENPFHRAAFGAPADSFIVGIVANLRPVKRVDRFLEVAAAVARAQPKAHFVVAGQGPLHVSLVSQATELGLGGRICFLGHVADVAACIQNFDVGLLTSASEGLSNALIEYADAGVPAVAFDTGGNREVVRHGLTGFLHADGDIRGMADSVIRLLEDPELRAVMAREAASIAREAYSPEHILQEYVSLWTS